MAEQAPKLMTVDEFLAWDDGTDTRYELADGIVRAMAPAQGPHTTIAANVTGIIHAALRSRRPCRPQSEVGIRISERTMWHADVVVTCAAPAPETVEPLLIVEVLSPSTRNHDLGRKLNDYRGLPSVKEVWMVDSERRWVQHWRRDADHWIVRDFVGQARFASPTLDGEVDLEDLYADSGL